MEESIKRAEKLLHATNSALAQMKYNLTFDNGKKEPGKPARLCLKKRKMPLTPAEELEHFHTEFRADAKEMLSKMDKLLNLNQVPLMRDPGSEASRAREKMKKLNEILSDKKSAKLPQTEMSRQKLLNLIGEKNFRDPVASATNVKFTVPNAAREKIIRESSDKTKRRLNSNIESGNANRNSPGMDSEKADLFGNSKEELKRKLCETQDVVDRGFQTARQLNEKVDHMTKARGERKPKRTPSSGKSASNDEMMPSNGLDGCRRSESGETVSTIVSEKCSRCLKLKDERKTRRGNSEEKRGDFKTVENSIEGRNRLMNVVRREEASQKPCRPRLNVCHLPSICIRGSLQMQVVHSLEIPGEKKESVTSKENTSIKIVSHEEMDKNKGEISNDQTKGKNCFCWTKEETVNRVECFNCGKLIRVRETRVDPRELDRLLLRCHFNVFDPRIDEFVNRCKRLPARTAETGEKEEKKENDGISSEKQVEEVVASLGEKVAERVPSIKASEKPKRNFKIDKLCKNLTRRYEEEANQLEDIRQEFDSVLKGLFRKIDESRKLFDIDYNLSPSVSVEKKIARRKTNLGITKPVVMSLGENGQEKTNGNVDVKCEKAEEEKISSYEKHHGRKERRKKTEKDDVKKKRVIGRGSKALVEETIGIKIINEKTGNRLETRESSTEKFEPRSTKIPNTCGSGESFEGKNNNGENGEKKDEKNKEANNCLVKPGLTENCSISGESFDEAFSDSDGRNNDDYESDFERESPTMRYESQGNASDEDVVAIPCVKKLSTISEVESEIEQKSSDNSSFVGKKSDSAKKKPNEGIDMNDEIEHVLARAFKKGIAYTLKHQEEVLETMPAKEPKGIDQSPSTFPVRSTADFGSASTTIAVAESPKLSGERAKSSKSKSEISSHSQKTSSTEVVASLKEVLSALKDQFARTQSLADKLTENARTLNETEKKSSESIRGGLPADTYLMQNLQQLKKDLEGGDSPVEAKSVSGAWKSCSLERDKHSESDEKSSISDSKLYIEEELSVGEVCCYSGGSPRKRAEDEKNEKNSSAIESFRGSKFANAKRLPANLHSPKLNGEKNTMAGFFPPSFLQHSRSEENSISEGEIVKNRNVNVSEDCSSIQSIGEIITESTSAASQEMN